MSGRAEWGHTWCRNGSRVRWLEAELFPPGDLPSGGGVDKKNFLRISNLPSGAAHYSRPGCHQLEWSPPLWRSSPSPLWRDAPPHPRPPPPCPCPRSGPSGRWWCWQGGARAGAGAVARSPCKLGRERGGWESWDQSEPPGEEDQGFSFYIFDSLGNGSSNTDYSCP